MLNLKKQVNILKYQIIPSECGLPLGKSNISQPKEVIEDTLSMTTSTKQNNLNVKKSSMLVFHLENNKMTLKDNQIISNQNTLNTSSSQTLVQESTLKELDLKGFWKESSMEEYKKLWLPTKTALADLDTLCLNGFSNNTTQNSFVIQNRKLMKQKNYQKTSWLSSLSLLPDTMDKENIKTSHYCRKIRFYPSTNHKVLLDKCFGATRYLINKALKEIKEGKITKMCNPIEVRNHLKYQDKNLSDKELWLKEIPFDTREGAIRQLCSNFKTAFTQLRNKTISNFKMKYKSKKNPKQICFVNKKAFNFKDKTLFKSRVKDKIIFKENIDEYQDTGTITIVREKGRYYMCFPLQRENTNTNTPFKSVALDPGLKTFQTFYSVFTENQSKKQS